MRVVGYCRLSRDEDKENYASIEEQQNIISEYAATRDWKIDKFYIDDNVSGYTFERPEFSKMINEVKIGTIDVVIAKDLSRIGRNNGKTLVLIDEFKALRKNLILVYEMGGTYDVLNDRDDTIGITTWFNERYVKDISRKVRANMHSKQKSGKLIMGNYYGYIKDNEDKTKLILDEEIKLCIETIFKLYIESGLGCKKICDILNSEYNFPTPSVWYQRRHLEKGKIYKHPVQEKWSTYMIKNIITNDVYIGNLRTHKKQTISIRGPAEKLPEELHYVFPNHHEPMVSKETFDLANEIMKKRAKTSSSYTKKMHDYIFGGFVQCGECGFSGTGIMINRKVRVKGYECIEYRKYGKQRCVFHEIEESIILEHFKNFLKLLKKEYNDILKSISIESKIKTNNSLKDKLKHELTILNNEYKLLLNQKIKDMLKADETSQELIRTNYEQLEQEKIIRINEIQKKLEELSNLDINLITKKIKTATDYFDEIIYSDNPNKMTLDIILNKIYIYKDKTCKFDLKMNIKELL